MFGGLGLTALDDIAGMAWAASLATCWPNLATALGKRNDPPCLDAARAAERTKHRLTYRG